MTIIVTGGAGFIGSNFIFHMLSEHPGYRIICLDKLTYAGNLSTLKSVMDNPDFRFVKADICDREAVEKLFEEEKPDIVVNFAAESHVDRSIENPGIFLQTNIIGTEVLMDACRKYGIQRYHQVSTDEVYGDLPLDRPDLFFTEETGHEIFIVQVKRPGDSAYIDFPSGTLKAVAEGEIRLQSLSGDGEIVRAAASTTTPSMSPVAVHEKPMSFGSNGITTVSP